MMHCPKKRLLLELNNFLKKIDLLLKFYNRNNPANLHIQSVKTTLFQANLKKLN